MRSAGRPPGPRGLSAAGLRRDSHPSAGHPPAPRHQPGHGDRGGQPPQGPAPPGPPTQDPSQTQDLAGWLRAAITLLPPTLAGAPTQPLEVGRATRVIHPAQRSALAVRDGGCVFPHCQRPPESGAKPTTSGTGSMAAPPTSTNLALFCRAHHRAVHEGGWQLQRDPDGPPDRHPAASATSHRPTTSRRRLNRPGRTPV